MWASLDGGLSWSRCSLAGDYTTYIRSEMGLALLDVAVMTPAETRTALGLKRHH